MLAVGEGHHGNLRAAQEFFDNDAPAGVAEHPADQGVLNGLHGLLSSAGDGDALAGGQPVGFDRERVVLRVEKRDGVGGDIEGGEVAGGEIMAGEEVLAPDLAAFQDGGRPGRAEDAQAPGLEGVHDPFRQRNLRPHDGQADLLALGEVGQTGQVGGGEGEAGGKLGDSRAAGRGRRCAPRAGCGRASTPGRARGRRNR